MNQKIPAQSTEEASESYFPPYPRIYLVLNPVAGGDEPVINKINDFFPPAGIHQDVGIIHKYGDAQDLARKAAQIEYDLVAGYGSDGT